MNTQMAKYFWDLNEAALKETPKILGDPAHPRFSERLVTILSRCDRPAELFGIISQDTFVNVWPRVRRYWRKLSGDNALRHWWQTVYEQLVEELKIKNRIPAGAPPKILTRLGQTIRKARLEKGWSQRELAHHVGMEQPVISLIEEGKKNVTVMTAAMLAKSLGIKGMEF